MKSRQKILLTGGAGYIGSHVAVKLQEAGYEVAILDNFSNSRPEVIEAIARVSGVRPELEEFDMLERARLEELLARESYAGVIHLAGLKAVGESTADPGRYYRTNLTILLNLLDGLRASKNSSAARVVFSSSATVYGEPHFLPYTEEHPIGLGVTNPYGWTKAMGEQILRDYANYVTSPVASISLRYFNPIGAHPSGFLGEDPEGLPNNVMPYITRVAAGRLPELQIFGGDYATQDGSCERDYIHVQDLARAHEAALTKLLTVDSSSSAADLGLSTAYNVGTGKPVSVFELVKAFEEANELQLPSRVVERRAGDLPSFYADATAIREALGWQSELTLLDACRDAWRFERLKSQS